jgi:MFS family permease
MTNGHTTTGRPARLTRLQWLICGVAALGFAFDSYELLMLPLIVRPALADLLHVDSNSLAVNDWVGTIQYVPALCGGVFGLLGGYLTDLFGRRRVLVWSILLYAFSALFAAYSTSVGELLFWRCCTFVGVCVEFVAAVAWLAELFDDPRQRERVLGYTQAFGSIGGLMATAAYKLIVTHEDAFFAIRGGHDAWRYTLMSGVIPAIPLIVIRPFLPESPAWQRKKRAGTLKRPSFSELFEPRFARTTIVTTIMMACAYAAAFGAIQQMPRIVPGLAELRGLARPAQEQIIGSVQLFQEFGGLAGRILLAYLAATIVLRRRLLYTFQIPGLLLLPSCSCSCRAWDCRSRGGGSFSSG